MGSVSSKTVKEEQSRKDFHQIFTNLHNDCYLAAGACYYSAEWHEKMARYSDRLSSMFGVFSAGGFGLMHFYKEGLTAKSRGVLGGTSTVLAACFALSAFFHGLKDSSRSPSVLSAKFNDAAAEWDELQHILDYYRTIKVKDPKVNLSELEMMNREILRRRKEIGLKAKVEEWAFKKMLKEESLYSQEIQNALEPPKKTVVESTKISEEINLQKKEETDA